MRVLLSTVSAGLALASWSAVAHGAAAVAANIDAGFAQDGATTYCQGVNGARGSPLEFNALEAHNAGRCPITVKLDIKATTVGTQTPMDVQWAASVRAGDIPNNIFPRAVDAATKKPQNVIASLLRACKAGTNCAPESVVVPQVVGDSTAETGAFDAQGNKPLRTHRFQFKDPGHYVMVGVVTLPGDSALNVSATEFLTLQRITVVEGVGPATVSPGTQLPGVNNATNNAATNEVGGEAKTSNINFQDSLVKSTAGATDATSASSSSEKLRGSSGGVDASFSGNNKSGDASTASTGSNLNTMLVIGAVAVVLVAVLMYFVVVRRKHSSHASKDHKKPLDPSSQAGIFRLDASGDSDMASSLSMAPLPNKKQFAHHEGSASVYSGTSSERSLAPPRFTTSSETSSMASGSVDSGPFGRATRQHHPSSQFPSYENAALAASGKEFKPTGGRKHSIVSVASSGFSSFHDGSANGEDVGTFGDLHDSAESLPVVKRKQQSRASVASSVSSYGEYDSGARASSRLYSEGSVNLPRGMSEFSDRASEYSSSSFGDRRSTELGALSERGTRLGEYEV